nr:thaumatin-like protein [Allium sativum]UPH74560.1 thaumatin-like protein [Allium sativum]
MSRTLLIFPILFLIHLTQIQSSTFRITNNCPYTVWPGLLSGAGTAPLSTTGFTLPSGSSESISVPSGWSGRFWGRTLCTTSSNGKFSCITGDCGSNAVQCSGAGAAPPATLAEFTLNGSGELDFYDVSLVDGYNLPMLISPSNQRIGNCTKTGCLVDLNDVCPNDLKVRAADANVACKSACEAFNTPEFCCSGEYGNPNTCKPSSYSQVFKNACPRAYSYAYDDGTSTFTCGQGADYEITFCPKSARSEPQAAGLPVINESMVFLGGDEVGGAGGLHWNVLGFAMAVGVGMILILGF